MITALVFIEHVRNLTLVKEQPYAIQVYMITHLTKPGYLWHIF